MMRHFQWLLDSHYIDIIAMYLPEIADDLNLNLIAGLSNLHRKEKGFISG